MKKRDFSAKSLFLRYELLLFACVFLLIIGILAYTNYSYQRNLENTTGTTVRYYINSKEEMMSNVEHVLFNIAANDYSFQNIAYTTDRTQAYFSAYQVKEKLSTLLDNTAIWMVLGFTPRIILTFIPVFIAREFPGRNAK